MPVSPSAPDAVAPVALCARGLVKRYGERVALRGLDLDVRAGEALLLLGPNGAGKTTLFHLLAGTLTPDAGRVDVVGLGPPSCARARARIGVAPQSIALYGELTAEENLRFFGRIQGLWGARLRERVAWALAMAELSERARDRAADLSGGMQRRLNLAAAALHEPAVLLLDEPTAGVDPASRARIFDAIASLRRGGVAIVVSTHHLDEAERLADTALVLERGAVVARGSAREILRSHAMGASLESASVAVTGGPSR